MTIRRILLVLFVSVVLLLVAGCNRDGKSVFTFKIASASGTSYVVVRDGSDYNNIYVDQNQKVIYCPKGPDKLIKFPNPLQWLGTSDDDGEIPAKTVCKWGQKKFDQFLELYTDGTANLDQ